ncbi:MAG: hypothetical protein DCF15_18110 [Phormidesmis priestleyi]|uniref:HTH cro/C1-type domain-containing protein n=1 Tax=Phormidesmis priestleyi TaxID=268141 RepID=A0A2W4WV85_9CYAN|nr:MAG: hypothetical protein DCF15_18110 [Phormidesmis priestleyi]
MAPIVSDSSPLKALMQQANIDSYRALALQAGVSRWQVQQLRLGKIGQMRVEALTKIAIALNIPLNALLTKFDLTDDRLQPSENSPLTHQLAELQREYQRLQQQQAEQIAAVRSQVQLDALQTLESWLIQWPTIAHKAQINTDLAAVKILPFIKPIHQLMDEWGVEAIASIDAQIPYDPQLHQLTKGTTNPGELVCVTHSGCRYQGKLLHRAKVKPLDSAPI